MTNKKIPEPGPARDRMVAEVVFGWADAVVSGTDVVGTNPMTGEMDLFPRASRTVEAALAALEAWRVAVDGRKYVIDSPGSGSNDDVFGVTLYGPIDMNGEDGCGPTLPAAATAALLQTRGEGT